MALEPITLVSVAICDLCGAKETHASTAASPSAADYLTGLGWRILLHRLLDGKPVGAMCPDCAPLWPVPTAAAAT